VTPQPRAGEQAGQTMQQRPCGVGGACPYQHVGPSAPPLRIGEGFVQGGDEGARTQRGDGKPQASMAGILAPHQGEAGPGDEGQGQALAEIRHGRPAATPHHERQDRDIKHQSVGGFPGQGEGSGGKQQQGRAHPARLGHSTFFGSCVPQAMSTR
jgi:hypothetical protein